MGVSISELLILLVIAVVLFGSSRLRDVGSDLGEAIKSFRKAFKHTEEKAPYSGEDTKTIDGEVISSKHEKN